MEAPGFSFGNGPCVADASAGPREHRFNPYDNNGGATLGIAGANFVVIAADTRLTTGFHINSRHHPKLFKIGGTTVDQRDATMVLGVTGFLADGEALQEKLDTICNMYRYRHGKPMGIAACARRLSTILYHKRFFPFYCWPLLVGVAEDGTGVIYSYDPVGSYERTTRAAFGAAASLLVPFLDNQVAFENQYLPGSGVGLALQERPVQPLARNKIEMLVKDAFDGAVERHIEVGDGLQIMTLTATGIEETMLPLKKD